MSFLQKMFFRGPKIDTASAGIDQFTYLMNYREHYAPILEDHISDRALAELYLFRGWTTQFGYRIFSSNPEASEKLIGETVNSTKYLGLGIFKVTHNFSVEEVLGDEYMNLVETRWQAYDVRVSTDLGKGIPTRQIVGVLDDFMQIQDPVVTMKLSTDFLVHMDAIKRIAMEIGLLRVRRK